MMRETRRLYELQSIDSQIGDFQAEIEQLNAKIGDSSAVLREQDALQELQDQLKECGTRHRDLDFELDDLQGKVNKLNDKLYGGKVGNPKELMSIEQEAGNFKAEMAKREDSLLELMAEEDALHKNVLKQSEQVKIVEKSWKQEQEILTRKKDGLEKEMSRLLKDRQEVASSIDSQTLFLYDSLKSRKGEAVVRVEQGRCQGCRLTLPVNEWQRVRTGTLVQCSSCNKILYLE